MGWEASPEGISFRSLLLPQGPLITLVGGAGVGKVGVGWKISSCIMKRRILAEIYIHVCECVWGINRKVKSLLAILHQRFKRYVKNTWIINPICTRCVRMSEKVWDVNAFERCDWMCFSSFQCVNVAVFLCLHTRWFPVKSFRVDSFYLQRTPDKHIGMYLSRLGLCSQNCTISFTVPASLLNRLCKMVICTHQGKSNQ